MSKRKRIIVNNKKAETLTVICTRCIIFKSFDLILDRFRRKAKIDGTINSVVEAKNPFKLELK